MVPCGADVVPYGADVVPYGADVVPCGADAVLYRLINQLIIKNFSLGRLRSSLDQLPSIRNCCNSRLSINLGHFHNLFLLLYVF